MSNKKAMENINHIIEMIDFFQSGNGVINKKIMILTTCVTSIHLKTF